MSIWALHDYDPKLKAKGSINITKYIHDVKRMDDVAEIGNKKGYGIFWVVNEMVDENDNTKGAREKKNLKKINYWYCDIDNGTKEEQKERINALPLLPSFIVETKKGFHCYWAVKGMATLENFTKIEEVLIELLDGDKHCKDPLRLLRAPGYYHMKDCAHPFLCQIVEGFGSDMEYTENQMLMAFKKYIKNPQKNNIKPINVEGKTDKEILNILKPQAMGADSGRHSYLMDKIGYMRRLGFDDSEREKWVDVLNSYFSVPLEQAEIESIKRSTRGAYRC